MFNPLLKLLFMITLLLTFVGQTMAYHVDVGHENTANLQTETQQLMLVDHDDSNHVSEGTDDCCDVECCENECICPSNTCTSVAYLDSILQLTASVTLSDSVLLLEQKPPHFIILPHYRPPIFTS